MGMLPDRLTPELLSVPIAVPGVKVPSAFDKYAVNTFPALKLPVDVKATDPAPVEVQLPKLKGEPVTAPVVILQPLSVIEKADVALPVSVGVLDTISISYPVPAAVPPGMVILIVPEFPVEESEPILTGEEKLPLALDK